MGGVISSCNCESGDNNTFHLPTMQAYCLFLAAWPANAELSAQMVPLGVWPDPLGFNTCLPQQFKQTPLPISYSQFIFIIHIVHNW